jgi:hypothetical protein
MNIHQIPVGTTKELTQEEADKLIQESWPVIDYRVHTSEVHTPTDDDMGVDLKYSAAFWRLYLYALVLTLVGALGTVLL